ncbi:complex I subunit 1 family protein [Elusimicrobiota bacterium]
MVVAFLVSWIDRKVSALVHWRVGPPVLQSYYDFMKLMKKETIIPKEANTIVFLLSPIVSFAALVLISILLVKSNITRTGYMGDIIVVIYMLIIPSLAVMMGGAASANPLASLGASREMKMVLSYELPFIIALCVVLIKTQGALGIDGIISYQVQNGIIIGSVSGFLAFVVTFICFQSKMAQIPFDIPEAEQEIMGGAVIEYSGPPLGLFVISRWILMALLPYLIVILFLGGVNSILGICKYVAVLVLVILTKNTNPRLTIKQTVNFFWGYVTIIAVAAVILAFIGL